MKNVEDIEKHELDIAIIGISGRFPGANSVSGFWDNLVKGEEGISTLTDEQLKQAGVDSSVYNNPDYVKKAPVIENYDMFDPSFFGYSPREANMMDPQQRIFLECAWEALESAGYNPEDYPEPIGVYGGSAMNTYFMYSGLISQFADEYLPTLLGNDNSFLTTRASYKLNLKGPSVTVQTACSTGLVAVHMACQSLLSFESSMALAGGVSVRVPHHNGYTYQEGSVFSRDGRCRPFDAKASGTIFGSGAGIVLLKRYADAIKDGDHIIAVIKGSAINNDGSSKTDYTAPSVNSQAEAIVEALECAGTGAESISYVEAHGTGTYLGDPIEIRALTKAFRSYTNKKGYCAIGSVKSNIGHLDAAAGIVGLIKTALSLKNKIIPPSLHFEEPNPEIDFKNSPFFVNTQASVWERNGTPLRAGITSLGMGGTNAHVILEEYFENEPQEILDNKDSGKHKLFTFSAKSEKALFDTIYNFKTHLEENPETGLNKAAYTLQTGRKQFEFCNCVVATGNEDVLTKLEQSLKAKKFRKKSTMDEVVFMFPGQGAQYVNMGRELYEDEALFRETVDKCAELFKTEIDLDIRKVIYPVGKYDEEELSLKLQDTKITQPVLLTVEYALAKLWMSWGITPDTVIGHSIGEYTAGLVAGVFTLEDCVKLVACRGTLMSELPTGTMLAVSLPEHKVESYLNDKIELAAVNSSAACVLSGESSHIKSLEEKLTEDNVGCRILHTSHAFHSYMMEPMLEDFFKAANQVTYRKPRFSVISTVKGDLIDAEEITNANYWVQNIRQPVRFADGINTVKSDLPKLLLEVGPGQTLSTLSRQELSAEDETVILQSIRHPKQKKSDYQFILQSLGRIWETGLKINWSRLHEKSSRKKIPLPTYPFERQRCWMEPIGNGRQKTSLNKSLLKETEPAGNVYVPVWKQLPPIQSDISVLEQEVWLVFDDEQETGLHLTGMCGLSRKNIVLVKEGQHFEKLSDQVFSVHPENPAHYVSLIEVLKQDGLLPDRVLHFWNLDVRGETGQDLRSENHQKYGFYSILYLAKALVSAEVSTELKLDVIVNDLHNVTGFECGSADTSTTLGICNVIPQEYPNINCRVIDIEKREEEALTLERLSMEVSCSEPLKRVIHRKGKRWGQIFEQYPELFNNKYSERLGKNGAYIITGGLGEVGFLFADYLAGEENSKIIITGRSAIPDPMEWDDYLKDSSADDRVSEKIQKLVSLRKKGAAVKYLKADVSDEQKMQEVINTVEDQHGNINGIIHAAGDVSAISIEHLSKDDCERYFESKVLGSINILEAVENSNCGFIMFTSSLSALLGGYGFAGYAASNIFMDFVSQKETGRHSPRLISVNWDAIQSTAASKGMDQETLISQYQLKEIFGLIIKSGYAGQLAVSATDLNMRIELQRSLESSANNDDYKVPSESGHEENSTEYLLNIWREYLGVEEISEDDDFFELGGNSLIAVQMFNRIKKETGTALPMAKIFEHSTIHELAPLLNQKEEEREEFEI